MNDRLYRCSPLSRVIDPHRDAKLAQLVRVVSGDFPHSEVLKGRSTGGDPAHRSSEDYGERCPCVAVVRVGGELENERGIVDAVGFELIQQGVDSFWVFEGKFCMQ